MKATGIVRRIDDLGRVVIPKEIRRTLHIRESNLSPARLSRYHNPEAQRPIDRYASGFERSAPHSSARIFRGNPYFSPASRDVTS